MTTPRTYFALVGILMGAFVGCTTVTQPATRIRYFDDSRITASDPFLSRLQARTSEQEKQLEEERKTLGESGNKALRSLPFPTTDFAKRKIGDIYFPPLSKDYRSDLMVTNWYGTEYRNLFTLECFSFWGADPAEWPIDLVVSCIVLPFALTGDVLSGFTMQYRKDRSETKEEAMTREQENIYRRLVALYKIRKTEANSRTDIGEAAEAKRAEKMRLLSVANQILDGSSFEKFKLGQQHVAFAKAEIPLVYSACVDLKTEITARAEQIKGIDSLATELFPPDGMDAPDSQLVSEQNLEKSIEKLFEKYSNYDSKIRDLYVTKEVELLSATDDDERQKLLKVYEDAKKALIQQSQKDSE